jgi:hypothetical protein
MLEVFVQVFVKFLKEIRLDKTLKHFEKSDKDGLVFVNKMK